MIQKYKGIEPQIHPGCFIAEGACVVGDVKIGADSSVWFNTVIRGDMAQIVIGHGTNIQDNCTLHCVNDIKTEIGNNVTVGHGAILHSCTVGDNSLIGMGAIVLDGVSIGKNCLVGAGSLVAPNTVIPEGSLVIGSPAKVKRLLTEEELQNIGRNAREYINLASNYVGDGVGR